MNWLLHQLGRLLPTRNNYPGMTDARLPLPPTPYWTVQRVLDQLEASATDRRDMRALGKLRAARNVITTEALRSHG
jgi:hypothetical protein